MAPPSSVAMVSEVAARISLFLRVRPPILPAVMKASGSGFGIRMQLPRSEFEGRRLIRARN